MQCARTRRPHRSRGWSSSFAIAGLAAVLISLTVGPPASAATLERVKQAGKITLGYRADARPFAFRDESGNAAGYSVALCQKIAEQVKAEFGLSTLAVEWSPVTVEDQFRAVQENKVDLLCGVDETRRGERTSISQFRSFRVESEHFCVPMLRPDCRRFC
jgi:ABC-type amino acid transport substrate-binding protein